MSKNSHGYTPLQPVKQDSARRSLVKNPFATNNFDSPNDKGASDEEFDDERDENSDIEMPVAVGGKNDY